MRLSLQDRVHIKPLSATGKTRRVGKCGSESEATDPAWEAKVGAPYLALSPQAPGCLSGTEASTSSSPAHSQ